MDGARELVFGALFYFLFFVCDGGECLGPAYVCVCGRSVIVVVRCSRSLVLVVCKTDTERGSESFFFCHLIVWFLF